MADKKTTYTIEILGKHHKKNDFTCGEESLDHYLKKQAGQEKRKQVSVTYVLSPEHNREEVAGYYTLSNYYLKVAELPEDQAKGLPRYPELGATLIGRLAVSNQFQGEKLGKVLLIDALKRSCELSSQSGSVAVVVDALNDKANAFYRHHGFIEFPTAENRLFILMKTAKQLFD